jgi:hypothetical protein
MCMRLHRVVVFDLLLSPSSAASLPRPPTEPPTKKSSSSTPARLQQQRQHQLHPTSRSEQAKRHRNPSTAWCNNSQHNHTHHPHTHTRTHAHTPCVFALSVCLPSSYAPSLPKDTHCALVCPVVDGYINCPAASYLPHPPLATSTRSTHFPPPTNTLQSSEPARSLSGQSTPSPLHRRSCTTAPPHIHTHNYHQIQSQAWTTKTSSTS